MGIFTVWKEVLVDARAIPWVESSFLYHPDVD